LSTSPASASKTSDAATGVPATAATASSVKLPREDPEPAQHRLLGFREQLNSITARSVCRRGTAVRLPAVSRRSRIQARQQLFLPEHLRPWCRQLDRQRNSVQSAADLATMGAVSSVSERSASAAAARAMKSGTALCSIAGPQ